MNFIAIDVETANADMASICAVGICRFAGGVPAGDMHFLVDPEDEFDRLNVAIHGIEPEMVAGAPTMGHVMPLLIEALAAEVVVHHTHFDRVALERAATRAGQAGTGLRWLDTARIARRTWADVASRGYGLRNLADRFSITFRHHDAREDARAAGLVLVRAIEETGLDLEAWFARVAEPIDPERASQARAKLAGNPAGHLAGETVVFTGALAMPRADAAQLAGCAGCNVDPGVTKATTILVVGDQDVRKVGVSGKSAKHLKAEAMVASGAALRIVRESDFRELVVMGSVKWK